ncbi:DedA family inner membrane protein YdjZ [Desulfosporosinus metallidurans]|uniref:DedA family inner membrane protein YdjZ n=1 Tax=Desulfosporosinus metallidurans TaxID=1888891 RepID=A0A1Q8R068_9FIRM|nr:DedA family inner membrane protein YdjZ [Desulfosporosinus metallidurans]
MAVFLGTGLGLLPATLVYSYVGDMLVGNVRTVVFGLLLLFSFSVLVLLIKRIFKGKQ